VADTLRPRPVPDELLTRRELAHAMKCSVATIDRMKAAGMPYVPWGRRLVRFRLRDTMQWREAQEQREAA
jgi:phage terminase Nu1 subunit (DNA packaging protein)